MEILRLQACLLDFNVPDLGEKYNMGSGTLCAHCETEPTPNSIDDLSPQISILTGGTTIEVWFVRISVSLDPVSGNSASPNAIFVFLI